MNHGYLLIVQELQKDWQNFGPYLNLSGLQFCSVYQTLPTFVYDSLWIPLVESNGFYASLPLISTALNTFLMRNNSINPAQLHKQYEYIAALLCGPILFYKTHNCTTQQIINRAKELKKTWKLLPNICSHLIPLLEGVEQKQNEPESKRQKIVNDLLILFETNESKLDYKNYGLHLLNQAVGEVIYDIVQQGYSYKELYEKLYLSNKDKIIAFFSKIKRKQQLCASILSQVIRPENNISQLDKIRNVLLFFIFTQSWDRFKQNQSRLKEPVVIQTVAQAFHRLLFLAFDNQQPITSIILQFLLESKFTLFQELKSSASSHLLALFKLYSYAQNDKISGLIEDIWKQKMKGTRLFELQLTQYPPFVGRTGIQQKLEEGTTRSISSRSTISEHFSLKSSFASKNRKRRTTRSTCLNKQINQIEEQLKKCNFEKLYLLLDEFKKFYFSQYTQKGPDDSSRQNVLNIIVLVIKRLESTIQYRYNCEYLKKCIFLELADIIQKCCQSQFTSSQHGEKLNLLQCCYTQKGQVTLQSLIKFHIKNNYQEGLDTFFKLKLIEQDLNSNNLSGARLQSFQEQLDLLSFEGRIYSLYKSQFNETKRMESKKLIIISKLLLLKSKNVANNLLANYAYLMLKQERANEALYKKRIQNFMSFMNEHLQISTNNDKSQIFLKLGEILDEFEFQNSQTSLRVVDSMIGNKYFDLLRRKQHHNYYLVYFKKYLQMNYLKQALYFLQLHHFQHIQPKMEHAIIAANIYSRLTPSFKLHLNQILKKQQSKFPTITQNYFQARKQQSKCSIQQLILQAINHLEPVQILFTQASEHYRGQKPKNFLWIGYYYPFLSRLFNQLISQEESEQIDESLKRCAVLLIYLQMQINFIRDPLTSPTHEKLNQITSLIDKLGSQTYKNQLYSLFLKLFRKGSQSEQLQRLYIQGLIKNKESEQVVKYLRKNIKEQQPFTKMATRYLCLLAKYHFQEAQFAKCLSIIKQIQDRKQKIDNPTEIYHLELQCRQSIILNYTLQQHLKLLNKCVLSSSKDLTPLNRDRHFQYYFKIFRNVFNRYNFDSTLQNEVFLETYFNFLEANGILRENTEYLSQAVFYLLRFLMQKLNLSESGQGKILQKLILQKLKGNLKVLIPYSSYLLRKISSTIQKNILIKGLIKAVTSQNPRECTWTLAFLRNFSLRSQKGRNSEQQACQIDGIADIYHQTADALKSRKAENKDHCLWIDSLIRLSFLEGEDKRKKCSQFRQISVPEGLLFMFDFDFYIRSVEDARVLSNGKSAPIQLTFRLIHVRDGYLKTVRAIIKSNVGTKNYRLQSNTANFFQEAGVIDSDATYKIFHLSKFLVVIEHRANCGTLTNVIFENLPDVKRLQGSIMMEMQKKKQIQKKQRRLLEVFDSINKPQFHIKFSEVIYYKARNIKDWWKKYCNFIRTNAQWSYMGYIIGLGDRHCDNILITEDIKLIHIDFQYVLDTGLALTFPEWVPFRLTSCLYQPLGILGAFGAFYGEMLQAAKNFQLREQNVWRALSNLVGSMNTNIGQQILNRARFLPHYKSTDDGIAKIIEFSKDPELLRLMFQGWRPYL